MNKIYFVHSGNESFTQIDGDILRSFAEVDDHYARSKFPKNISRYILGVRSADLVFCWFASWNSFWAVLIAKLFRKPSILIVGGYDVANIPEANYGNQRGGVMKWISRFAMKISSRMFTNSFYSKEEIRKNIGSIADRIEVIYHGVPDPIGSFPMFKRMNRVISVGGVDSSNLIRKGLEPFVRAASIMPDTEFVLIGGWLDNSIDYLRSITSPNVSFTGRISDDELHWYYSTSAVYVQASAHEGFGMSVAEAMLGGCIPVVTNAGSLPEVVGDIGVIISDANPETIALAIKKSLNATNDEREQARNRILHEFPVELRAKKIRELIDAVS